MQNPDFGARRAAVEERSSLKAELESSREAFRGACQQIKMLEGTIESQKAAASGALEEVQKLVASQKVAMEGDQGLKAELLDARGEANLANRRLAAQEECCQGLRAEMKEAVQQRNDAQSELLALKVEIPTLRRGSFGECTCRPFHRSRCGLF